jgi:hypothetical protein
LVDEGMLIDGSDVHSRNALFWKSETLHPGSNVTFERWWQQEKQFSGIISNDPGMQIDSRAEQFANAALRRT